MPIKVSSTASALSPVSFSPSRNTPSSRANITEVSRSAATSAIGALVNDQMTSP